MTPEEQQRAKQGVLLAIGAYTMWGIAPIYFKTISDVSPLEILSHRVVWSFFLLAALLHFGRRWRGVRDVLKSKIKMTYLLATSIVIAANWLIFIWAVNTNHMLDASLGYYINPLINVLLGMLFLGERLRKMQWFAVVLASCGVLVQLIAFGSVPVVAIVLALSFGCYGLLRKKVSLDAQTGLFIETLILLPAAAIYLLWIADSSTSDLMANPITLNLLLISAGVITTLPLLCFTGAATRLKLSTLGFFQYIGPSLMFLLAVLVYGEAFTADKAITFAFIW
jgi:chloramphenicol-sensitive protein RarD